MTCYYINQDGVLYADERHGLTGIEYEDPVEAIRECIARGTAKAENLIFARGHAEEQALIEEYHSYFESQKQYILDKSNELNSKTGIDNEFVLAMYNLDAHGIYYPDPITRAGESTTSLLEQALVGNNQAASDILNNARK